MIKKFEIDNEKHAIVMKLIEEIESIEKDGERYNEIQKELCKISNRDDIDLEDYEEYWGYTDLETISKGVLLPKPCKMGLSDEEIREVIGEIAGAKFDQVETDYWLAVIALETSIRGITNYIYYPDTKGLARDASVEDIANKILADRS